MPPPVDLDGLVARARLECRAAGIPQSQINAIEILARAVWHEQHAEIRAGWLKPSNDRMMPSRLKEGEGL